MIRSLDQLVQEVKATKRKYRVAVTWAQDPNTLGAIDRAQRDGFIEAILIGSVNDIAKVCSGLGISIDEYTLVDADNQTEAACKAVNMVRSGQADILMKGLIGTDIFLKAVLNREGGLMKDDAILSYVCAVQVPEYKKLLFITDTAVIPFPDLDQKIRMTTYALEMASQFGISRPKIALISASEKISKHFPSSHDYKEMCKLASEKYFGDCIMDGPLDVFLACDPKACRIKGVDTPVKGDADILLFPSLEACNAFYKGLMRFAGGELAGLLTGTTHPVVLMSRSESENSKYYCIALACLMAEK